jgi:hypothetical protein
MATDTKQNNTVMHFTSGSKDILSPSNDDRRFTVFVDDTKCEGIGCAYAPSCGRFVRPELPEQKWAAYYALPDDDCQYFESIILAEAKNAEA